MTNIQSKETLINSSASQNCLDVAYRYLGYRPRSEEELRQHLHKRGFGNEAIEKTITKLKEQNLVDDLAFAQFWKDNRLSFKPKSKRLIKRELRDKKIDQEIVEEVTRDIDDESSAYNLGCSRMHTLTHLDYPDFHRRLSNYLGYRGFSYEVIKRTITLLWRERECQQIRH